MNSFTFSTKNHEINFQNQRKGVSLSRKSYPNKQNNVDYGNWNGYQIITSKQGDFFKSFNFK